MESSGLLSAELIQKAIWFGGFGFVFLFGWWVLKKCVSISGRTIGSF